MYLVRVILEVTFVSDCREVVPKRRSMNEKGGIKRHIGLFNIQLQKNVSKFKSL